LDPDVHFEPLDLIVLVIAEALIARPFFTHQKGVVIVASIQFPAQN
jgi:hypothetical protein